MQCFCWRCVCLRWFIFCVPCSISIIFICIWVPFTCLSAMFCIPNSVVEAHFNSEIVLHLKIYKQFQTNYSMLKTLCDLHGLAFFDKISGESTRESSQIHNSVYRVINFSEFPQKANNNFDFDLWMMLIFCSILCCARASQWSKFAVKINWHWNNGSF